MKIQSPVVCLTFRRCGIQVRLLNGETEVDKEYVAVNEDCGEWQFVSGSVEATGAYTGVEYALVYDYNDNTSYFDGAQLFKESFAYSYTYDDNDRISKVTDLEGRETTYTYRGSSGDITKITLPGGAEYTYTYNSSNLLSGTTSAEGVKTTHSYDAWGNATQTTITYADNSGPVIQSDQTYTADGNFQTSATTGDRNTVTYNYDTDRATLTSVTDALSNTTTNAYDSMRRLISTTTGGASVSYAYDSADHLASITHTGATPTTYSFAYTTAGLTDTVSIGERVLADNAYNAGTWTLASQTYGNGQSWSYEYDAFDQLTRRYSGNIEFKYFYNSEGALARVEQYKNSVLTAVERWYYDTGDRLTRVVELDGSGNVTHSYGWSYDHNDNVTALTETVNGQTFTYNYSYNSDQQPTSMGGAVTKNYTYDNYGRLSGSSGGPLGVGYSYRTVEQNGTTYATTQIATLTNTYGGADHTLSYTYDANGNILSVSDGTNTTSYVYDTLGQLTRENNQAAGKTWTWTYDTGGNILSRSEYAYTTGELGAVTDTVSYTYGDAAWGDLLTAYDGSAITYDGVGNMTAYDGWTFTWQGGRQLAGMSKEGVNLTFDYNESGLRTKKSDGSTTHTYIYRGEQLIADVTATDALYFHYDHNGDVLGFSYNGAEYTYVKNLQGDILAILDSTGAEAAAYTYDAWGNILSATGDIAMRNPLRYRGYMYDTETGLYYLQSRYYDPEIGRFVNLDMQLSAEGGVTGMNLFAYCGNDPVNRTDSGGDAWWHWALGAAVVVACAVATVVTCGMSVAAAATAVGLVSSGMAASSTAATVAAAAFIGSATTFTALAVEAASSSNSAQDFADQGSMGTVAAVAGGAAINGGAAYVATMRSANTTVSPSTTTHVTGLGSPKNNPNPNGSYTQLDSHGNIYSYAQFDGSGRQTMRIDFQGRPHAGVLPHIHLFVYPEQGGKVDYVFNMNWELVSK